MASRIMIVVELPQPTEAVGELLTFVSSRFGDAPVTLADGDTAWIPEAGSWVVEIPTNNQIPPH